MSILLPNMGITYPHKGQSLLRHAPEQFIGTFLIPGGYGFDDYRVPDEWIDSVLKHSSDPNEPDESSPAILEMIENRRVGAEAHDSKDGMYLLIWIGMLASPTSPCDVSFCIQHVRLFELQLLLALQIENDIPTHTEVLSFWSFQENHRPELPKQLGMWTVANWEDYCHANFAGHGHGMYERWLAKTEPLRNP